MRHPIFPTSRLHSVPRPIFRPALGALAAPGATAASTAAVAAEAPTLTPSPAPTPTLAPMLAPPPPDAAQLAAPSPRDAPNNDAFSQYRTGAVSRPARLDSHSPTASEAGGSPSTSQPARDDDPVLAAGEGLGGW